MATASFVALLLALLPGCIAVVRLLEPIGLDKQNHTSSRFVYYGPREDTVLRGAAVFTSSSAICDVRQASAFAGKIVVADFSSLSMTCSHGRAYEVLSDAGALGLVVSVKTSPPSYFIAYSHENWFNPCAMCDRNMTMVAMTFPYDQSGWVDNWREASGMVVEIAPPHDNSFRDGVKRWWVVLLIRIVTPIMFAYTAAFAFVEAGRYSGEEFNSMGYWVNVIEAISCSAISAVLALGLFGDMVLPIVFYWFFADLLSGPCLLTTMMVALMMKESTRALEHGDAPRQLWHLYKWRIIAVGLLVPLPIVYVVYVALACYSTASGYPVIIEGVFAVWVVCFTLASLQITFYFMSQAWRYRGLVLGYLFGGTHASMDNPNRNYAQSAAEWRTGYVVFWLNVSGFMTLANMVLTALFNIGSQSSSSTSFVAQCWFFAVFTRLGISAAQLKAVLLNPSEVDYSLGLSQWWCLASKETQVRPGLEIADTQFSANDIPLDYFEEIAVKIPIEETAFPRIHNWNTHAGQHVSVSPLTI